MGLREGLRLAQPRLPAIGDGREVGVVAVRNF